ncbi:MAG: transglycosylase SLT domain-containing protein, partial [bacterium]|nr:transglycosylase SLT domain-containing protein [bacterium]
LLRMGMFSALAIGIHNFPEGLATFTSALADPTLGISIAVAIAIHNIPEGIADVIRKALLNNPADRYANAGAMWKDVENPPGKTNGNNSNTNAEFLLLNSYLKTGNNREANELFKELFAGNNLKPFQDYLSRQALNRFLRRLSFDDWYKKFKYLARGNRFSEFTRERRYANHPELVNLFYAEFYYQQKNYNQCRRYLGRVKSPLLNGYKTRMVLKMQLRDGQYDSLFNLLVTVRKEPELYLELLMDSASLLLIEGETGLSLKLLSRYIDTANQLQTQFTLLFNAIPSTVMGPDYWKSLWLAAWLNYRENNKTAAANYFKMCTDSPVDSYKIASRYWLGRLNKQDAGNGEPGAKHFPFTYYYTLDYPQKPPDIQSLEPFVQLLNQPRGPKFPGIVKRLKSLVRNNLMGDARQFIRWNVSTQPLTVSGRHTLMLIESIIHLKEGNDAMAFIRFRDNFQCYRCIRLPRFLRRIVLPLKYVDLVENYSDQYELDSWVVYSLIREESYFRPDVTSYANAHGLMQLLLKTARQVALTHGRKLYRRDLFIPKTNIRYGTEYLRLLLDKYDDKLHLALAAYNAGDHRVDKWIRQLGDVSDDEFIEMIPFSATRSYVKNILRNYYYYRFYYGENNE